MSTAFVADSEDNQARMQQAVAAQMRDRDAALMQYFYRSDVVYQRELETIFFKSWLWAGRVDQIPEPGDFFLYEIAEESVIVARGNDGEIRALINSCRHRGSRVCDERQGHCKTFVCPYHGWVYGTDGRLRAARPGWRGAGLARKTFGLKQARVAVRFGMIFINFDPDAFDFNDCLAQVDAQMNPYRLERAKIAHRESYPVDANWKIALGNYLECYHCETAHRPIRSAHRFKDRERVVADLNRAMWARASERHRRPRHRAAVTGCSGGAGFGSCVYTSRYALFEGFQTGSADGKPLAPLMGDFKGYDGGAGDCQFGPLTYMLENYPDHCVLFRYVPFGNGKTDMEIVWFVDGGARKGVDYDRDALTWLWHVTTLEDKRIMTLNAAGVNSRFFEPGPQHPEFEDTPKRFVDWYVHALAGDFKVVPPTVRAHRASSCEVTAHWSGSPSSGSRLSDVPTQNHALPRTNIELCLPQNWRRWAGYLVVGSYELSLDREYWAIRNAAALIDVTPLMKYIIEGQGCRALLHRVTPRDIDKMKVGQVYYTGWCDDEGKMIDDGTITRLGERELPHDLGGADRCAGCDERGRHGRGRSPKSPTRWRRSACRGRSRERS